MTSLQLGEFQLDLNLRLLSAPGRDPITLNWKTFSVLRSLIEAQSDIVTRATLIDSIWDGHYQVGDKALSTAIWNLRKCFENSSVNIETIPKVGYKVQVINTSNPALDVQSGSTSFGKDDDDSVILTPKLTLKACIVAGILLAVVLWF